MREKDVGANVIFPGFIWGMLFFQLKVLLSNFEDGIVYFCTGRPVHSKYTAFGRWFS